ncbi:hypothetical protein [Kineococcus sp. SYSU DK005]|uniref:hypothetical protein n=1 Tax=Kineococcus sp. SYSU DK005 TaxID=3383126 RepID=UPI003D7D55E2
MPRLTADTHARRAEEHAKVGRLMVQVGAEWGAVCLFYSAYHLVKRALILDPVFDNPVALAQVDLPEAARHPESHRGHTRSGGGRVWGVSDLVLKLYAPLEQPYKRLTVASHHVRYGRGFRGGAVGLQRLEQDLATIEQASAAGIMCGPMPMPTAVRRP